jgi:hypothetical protein
MNSSTLRKELALQQIGSVDSILKQYKPVFSLNEGSHETVTKTVKSVSQMPVHGQTDDIIIDLTDSKNIHVSEFNRSYFELYLDFTIDVSQGTFPLLPTTERPGFLPDTEQWTNWTTVPSLVDIAKVTYFFVGFKNATDCIHYYRITHNGRDVGPSIKDRAQYESYLYNVMKPECAKKNKRNTHTLWEDAHSHNPSVCGQYLSMWDLYQAQTTGNNSFHVNFPVTIGFDDLLPFQNFSDFPAAVLGDFKLIIRVSPDALVWCSVDPVASIKQQAEYYPFTQDQLGNHYNVIKFANAVGSSTANHNYDHRFTQVNATGRACTNVVADECAIDQLPNYAEYNGVDILLRPRDISVFSAQSILSGYKLNSLFFKNLTTEIFP